MAADTFVNPVTFRDEFDTTQATTQTLKAGSIINSEISSSAAIARTKLATDTSQAYPIPLTQLQVWDALQTNLPNTAASDDLAIITGTWATDAPRIRTSDGKATTVTQRAAFVFSPPPEYIAAGSFVMRFRCRMITTISDTTATVDCEAVRHDEDGAVGGDICATAAQSINSLTAGNKDFTITATTLSPGDTIMFRVTMAITDAATGSAVIGQISRITPLLSING